MSSDTKKTQAQAQAQPDAAATPETPAGAALPQLGGSYQRDPKTGALVRVAGTSAAPPMDRRNGPQPDTKGA